ncbi:MAG: AAA family ATPase [Arthrobacter sp.]
MAEKTLKPVPHDGWITNAMSNIFSRPYSASTSMTARKYLMPQVSTASGGTYSGFNIGTGEAAVIAILEEISRCPKGSMILIEEIEMAIHPSAQAKLAQVLIERAETHDLQIICTSHSRWFIDALPRQGRILIQPSENEHICMSNVTTRLAEGALLGKHQEELLVICEDAVGQMIIESALTMEQRNRVKIVPCGSKSELGRAATYSHLMHPTLPILIVWDGDATAKNIKDALHAADGGKHLLATDLIQWSRIGGVEIMAPGYQHVLTDAPEHQIKKTILDDPTAQEHVALAFGTERHKVRLMLETSAVEEKSHHRLFDDVVNKTGTSLEHVGRTLSVAYVNSLRTTSGQELPLVEAVSSMLDGHRYGFSQPWNDELPVSTDGVAA